MIYARGVVLTLSTLLLVVSRESKKHNYLLTYSSLAEGIHNSTYAIPTFQADPESGLSSADFDRIVRTGVPTVFSGVAKNWDALRGLSCSDFSDRWPNASMRAEYTGSPEPETFLKLGDSKWINSTRSPVGVNTPPADCDDESAKSSRPAVSPFVWHVKDRVKRSIKQEIANMFPGLPWLAGQPTLLDQHTRDSMEFWFQQVGAGTFAHNDGYCHSVYSVQLRGEKKWRLMLSPEIEALDTDVFDEFDSGIYKSVHKWEPDFEVVLKAGDGILFPPGYMHETRTVAGPSASDTCATSVTFNVPVPMPSKFVRKFMNRFSVSREIHHCMRRWESFVTASTQKVEWEKPYPNNAQPRSIAEGIFAAIDANHDATLSYGEIATYFVSPKVSGQFASQQSVYFGDLVYSFDQSRLLTDFQLHEALLIRATDTLDMWDVNDDGFASFEEVVDVIDYFQFYRWRQELVDTAVVVTTADGEEVNLPIGSEPFRKRLKIVDVIVGKIRPEPPTLDPAKYNHHTSRDDKDEL